MAKALTAGFIGLVLVTVSFLSLGATAFAPGDRRHRHKCTFV